MTLRLFLLSPQSVFTGLVDKTEFSYPVAEVPFSSGAATGTVVEGMTVLFGTSPGADDLGRQRLRAGSTIGATGTLNIGRSSEGTRDGEIIGQNNADITILNDYRVWAKIPRIEPDGTIYKDYDITVGTKTDNIPPKANIEPPAAAGDISAGGSVLTVDFDGTNSYALSGSISSYSWDVDDGTITVGTASSSAITATFPAGFRWVSLTITDSNGNTHTVRCPVYARDPASDTTIQSFQIERHRIMQHGQEISIRILEDIDEDTYPDGTLVMIWDDDLDTITDNDHMVFVGWHQTDPAEIRAGRTALLSEVRLDCLDVAGRLRTLPGFPISVEGNASPSTWLEMSSPNMQKYIDYILRWHSTALELTYATLAGGSYPFVILSSDAASLWEQASRRAKSLVPDYILTCDTKGRIGMAADPIVQVLGQRTATVQTTIDASEWSDISYTRQRSPRVHWLRSEAVLASADTIAAMFCVAPDDTPGQGASTRTQGEQLALNQNDLNATEGHRYARFNAFESPFRIDLAGSSRHGIEPANMTWVQLTMAAAYAAQRGLNFTNERGLVHEININWRNGRTGLVKDVSLTWERETSGVPARTYIPPPTGIDDDIPYEPPPDPGFDPDPAPDTGTGFGTVYVQTADTIARTSDFSASSPSWTDISPTTAANFISFILDPWRPSTTGFAVTDSDGIFRSEDLDQASPTWTHVLSASDMTTALSGIGATGFDGQEHHFEGSVNFDGHFLFIVRIARSGDDPMYCIRTTDRGDNWGYNEISSVSVGAAGWTGAAGIVQHVVSSNMRAFVSFRLGSGANQNRRMRSDDGGQNWSTVATDNSGGLPADSCVSMHIPYNDNATGQTFYIGTTIGLFKTTDGGTTFTQVASESVGIHRWGAESYTQNKQRLYRVDRDATPDTLYMTDDGFSTEYEPGMDGMSDTGIRATGGFPYNGAQFYLLSDAGIYVSTDRAESWADKTGDWAFGFTFVNSRRGTIVPLWTE